MNTAPCPACKEPNPYENIVCSFCGRRLPWADAVQGGPVVEGVVVEDYQPQPVAQAMQNPGDAYRKAQKKNFYNKEATAGDWLKAYFGFSAVACCFLPVFLFCAVFLIALIAAALGFR